jgi:tetratricopeptide (TPR) repeat protein
MNRQETEKTFYKNPYIYIVPILFSLYLVSRYTTENNKPSKRTSNESVTTQTRDKDKGELTKEQAEHIEEFKEIESPKQAIRTNLDYAETHYNLGCDYYVSGKYKEAIESYKQAIKINPDYAKAHYNLSVAYHFSNDRSSVLEQYNILENLDSKMANKLIKLINK